MEIKTGDTITIAGVMRKAINPDRRWWQFWKPRMVASDELQAFVAR